MLSAWCPAHESPVLVTPSQISAIDTVDGAMVVRFRCVCGATGAETITVRSRRRRAQVATP